LNPRETEVLSASDAWLWKEDQNEFFITQTYPIPASPAPADKRYGSPPEAFRCRNKNKNETGILSSELNCFKIIIPRYKKKYSEQNKNKKKTGRSCHGMTLRGYNIMNVGPRHGVAVQCSF